MAYFWCGPLVFSGLRGSDRPLSENTLNAALLALGFEMTAHGFRHMASTLLNDVGFNPYHIERQLAHKDKDAIRGTYNLAECAAEYQPMMQWYADHLDSLRTSQPIPKLAKAVGTTKTGRKAR